MNRFFVFIFIFMSMNRNVAAQKEMPLYEGAIPNRLTTGRDKPNRDSSVYSRVAQPSIRIYLPPKTAVPATAVIICAGGGYAELNIKREGYDVALA
ncbi:MAG: hypothetical protein WKF70_08115, partial [Chitinophagaceae bacterium]